MNPPPTRFALRLGVGAACAALLASGCRSSDPHAGQAELWLLERSQEARQAEDPEESLEYAEAVLDRPAHPEYTPEALYLAGEAQYTREKYKKAFAHYRTLIHDYPLSEYVPEIELQVYAIGRWYIDREPNWFFGDLFTGRERGMEVLREFSIAYPSSDLVDDAILAMGNYRYEREEYDYAAPHYERLVAEYPNSEWADLAGYRIGLCYRNYSRGAGYDRTPLMQSAAGYRRYLARAENTLHRKEAEEGLAWAEEQLAEGELKVARLYMIRHQDRGARIHLANAVLAYPRTQAAEKAREQLDERGWDLSLHSVDSLIDEASEALRGTQ